MPTDNRATAERIARDFAAVINSHSAENDSDTPDFILSNALTAMLDAMQRAIVARDDWYGGKPGMALRAPAPSEAVAVDAAKAVAIAARLTRFAHELGPEHPRYITVLNAALALEVSATHPAPARGVTGEMREAIMSAIEQAVASCVEQAGKRLPTEAWHVDYAGILDRVTDAMYTPDAEGGA